MFFSQLSQAMVEGIDLSLVIRKQADRLTVSVLPKSESLKDGTRNNIVPLVVSGYPAELDAGFIASAFRPLQRVEGLITNIVQFERQAEKAASESKQVKGRTGNKAGNETKEETEKRERYEKALKRADELIAARSFDDAMTALQQARLYAPQQQIKSIDEKIAAVKAELNQGSLFDATPPLGQQQSPAPIPPQRTIDTAQAIPQPMQRLHNVPDIPQAETSVPQQPPQQQIAPPVYSSGYADIQPRYPQTMSPKESGNMPAYDNPEYPPTYRPEEYAEYPDFPQSMIARQQNAQANNNPQIF